MSQVSDQRRLRQEYLRNRTKAHARVAVGLIVGIPMGLAFAWMALSTVNALGIYICYGSGSKPYAPDYRPYLKWAECFFALSLLTALLTWRSTKVFKKGIDQVKSLPYVPAISPDLLAAEEILVRGSEEPPTVQSEVLLRAATGSETPKEELLRMIELR